MHILLSIECRILLKASHLLCNEGRSTVLLPDGKVCWFKRQMKSNASADKILQN
jgi:hypothetical protein